MGRLTKKGLSSRIILFVLVMSMVFMKQNVYAETSADYEYSILSDNTIQITKYIGKDIDVIIPENIDGYVVSEIGGDTFFGCESIKSVTIPNTVTTILHPGISNCSSLEKIYISSSVKKINDTPGVKGYVTYFSGCTSLKEIIVDDNNQNYSSENGVLFSKDKTHLEYYPIGKTEKTYDIPDSVKTIGWCAFQGSALNNINISNSVEKIYINAFRDCDLLSSIIIPDSVSFLDVYAFNGCEGIKNIDVDANNKYYSSVDGVLFNKDQTELIRYPAGKIESEYKIPESVLKLSQYQPFEGCSNLEKIYLSEYFGVTPDYSGGSGFYANSIINCVSLKEILVDANNQYYSSVDGILFNKDQTELVYYPEGKREKVYVIPDSVNSLNPDAISKCSSLEEISVDINNESFTSEEGVLFTKDKTKLVYYPAGRTDIIYEIPDGVIKVGNGAFGGSCDYLKVIKIPDSTKEFGYNTIGNCKNLESIIITSSDSSILTNLFGYIAYKNITLYVPNEAINLFQEAVNGYSYNFTIKDMELYTPPKENILGDVDADENINATDALLILKYAAKINELTDMQLLVADTSKDKSVNALDALLILKYAAKIIDHF